MSGKKKKGSSSYKRKIEKEVKEWLESDVETAFIELEKVSSKEQLVWFNFCGDEETVRFAVNVPKRYPKVKDEKILVSCEVDGYEEWQQKVNEEIENSDGAKISLSDVLSKCAEFYLSMDDGEDYDEDDELGMDDDDGFMGFDAGEEADRRIREESEQKKRRKTDKERELEEKEFLEIGSPAATMRILTDLKEISKSDPKTMGFSVECTIDPKSGLENLYHWHIKLFGFDPKDPLGKDMIQCKKKTGYDYILLEMRFSGDYPFVPPFIRVIKPRFQFRTGHVTIGGSICMELLTMTGWNSSNDVESILIQVRAELLGGGARLDTSVQSKDWSYSEHEAWEAFNRAASTHGWSTKGLGPQMFPTL